MGNAYSQFLESDEPSIVEVFDGYRPPTRRRESPTRLSPLDTVREVYDEGTLSYIPSRLDFSDNLVQALKPDPQVLAHYIAHYFQDKDLVLIDCPPTESVFTQAAYHASRYVLVPVRPEYFATVGFPLLAKSTHPGTFWYRFDPSILRPLGFRCSPSRLHRSGPKTHRTVSTSLALSSTTDSTAGATTADLKSVEPCQRYLKRQRITTGISSHSRFPTHEVFPN